jgi:hypothetical protein
MPLPGLLEIVAFVRGLRNSTGGATRFQRRARVHEANAQTWILTPRRQARQRYTALPPKADICRFQLKLSSSVFFHSPRHRNGVKSDELEGHLQLGSTRDR